MRILLAVLAGVMASPAVAQIRPILAGPTQLTAKQVSGAIELDWLSPDPSNATITYNVLRSDGTTQPSAVISPRPVTRTTYLDPLTTLVLLQPKTYTYLVQAVWPNGTKRLSNLATITLPAAQQVPTGGLTKCLTFFDLPVQLTVESKQTVFLHLLVPVATHYPGPMTVTVSNSSNPARYPNVSFQAQLNPQTTDGGGSTTLAVAGAVAAVTSATIATTQNLPALSSPPATSYYEAFFPPLGVAGDMLSLALDIFASVTDAQCTVHTWQTHWTHSGPLP